MEVIVECRGPRRAPEHGDGSGAHPGLRATSDQEIREFPTFTERLVALRSWLLEHEVTLVVMQAIGVYWKPVWTRLVSSGVTPIRSSARDDDDTKGAFLVNGA